MSNWINVDVQMRVTNAHETDIINVFERYASEISGSEGGLRVSFNYETVSDKPNVRNHQKNFTFEPYKKLVGVNFVGNLRDVDNDGAEYRKGVMLDFYLNLVEFQLVESMVAVFNPKQFSDVFIVRAEGKNVTSYNEANMFVNSREY